MHKFFLKKILIPSYSFLVGSKYNFLYKKIIKTQWLKSDKIQEMQLKKIKQLVIYANNCIPFYKKLYNKLGIDPESIKSLDNFKKLPIITKDDIRKNIEELRSIKFDKRELKKSATGGSTGIPMPYYHTKLYEDFDGASIRRNFEWMGVKLGKPLAVLWGSAFDLSQAQKISGLLRDLSFNRLTLPAFKLDNESMGQYIIKLKKFKPKGLLGYTSALVKFAEYIENNKISIQIDSIINAAETIYNYQREYLAKTYKGKVYNRYGSREVGAIAAECSKCGNMHINEERVYIETDKNDHIIVTDLTNFGMGFIRYDTEDIGQISTKPCKCGRGLRYLTKLEGRVHDLIKNKEGAYLPGEFFPHLFKNFAGIKKFQVIQNKIDEIDLIIVKDPNKFNQDNIEYICQKINQCLPGVNIKIKFQNHIEVPPSGKHRFTISNIK